MRGRNCLALLALLGLNQPSAAQSFSDRMLCEWLPICVVSGECTNEGGYPVHSLERVEDTWLWDPLAEWDGFPVAVVETLPEAEAMAVDPSLDLGLVLVPMGRTDTGALIVDAYGFSNFPQRGLTNRPMRHHCTPVSDVSS